MINYLETVLLIDPSKQISCFGDPNIYEDLDWGSETPILKDALIAAAIADAKMHKIIEMSEKCQQDIISGFESDALGNMRIYDSEEVDQLNLIGSVTSTAPTPASPEGYSIYYASRPAPDGVKTYDLHSHFQLRQVLADGAQVKLNKLQKFNSLRVQIELLTELDQINNITW